MWQPTKSEVEGENPSEFKSTDRITISEEKMAEIETVIKSMSRHQLETISELVTKARATLEAERTSYKDKQGDLSIQWNGRAYAIMIEGMPSALKELTFADNVAAKDVFLYAVSQYNQHRDRNKLQKEVEDYYTNKYLGGRKAPVFR